MEKMQQEYSMQRVSYLSLTALISQCDAWVARHEAGRAIDAYRDWLTQHVDRHAAPAAFNLGVLLHQAGDTQGSLQAYSKALELNPQLYQAAVNLGLRKESMGNAEEALIHWQSALLPVKGQTMLLNHIGRVLERQRRYAQAEQMLYHSLLLDSRQPDVVQHWIHLRQRQCKWPVLQSIPAIYGPEASADDLMRDLGPLGCLAYTDEPEEQLNVMRRWAQRKIPQDLPVLAPANGYDWSGRRVRVGYLSADFKWHAVGILAAPLLEQHDRNRVEVCALDMTPTPSPSDSLRQRILRAVEVHVPLQNLTDAQAAQRIRDMEIDVLVDLTGLTAGARPAILAYKPAPVQVSYLGFIGTTGIPQMDYVLTDKTALPQELAEHYTEKPLYMPRCYQVNDPAREVALPPTREGCGLPEKGTVFCSLNNSYKITSEVFQIWMRILRQTPDSVLWLVGDDPSVVSNLRASAQAHDVDPARLIFDDRVPPEQHVARMACADLFLDTAPYGAGITASEALWMGLPIVTCPGKTFASRMAASRLAAVGLSKLITPNWESYEKLACHLATRPDLLSTLRSHLLTEGRKSALFDPAGFARDWEDLIEQIALHAGRG